MVDEMDTETIIILKAFFIVIAVTSLFFIVTYGGMVNEDELLSKQKEDLIMLNNKININSIVVRGNMTDDSGVGHGHAWVGLEIRFDPTMDKITFSTAPYEYSGDKWKYWYNVCIGEINNDLG